MFLTAAMMGVDMATHTGPDLVRTSQKLRSKKDYGGDGDC